MTKREFGVRSYFLAVALLAAAGVLALEVLAARTLAPRLGTGAVVWAAVLAVALGALAVGNLLGGLLGLKLRPAAVAVWAPLLAGGATVALAKWHMATMDWAARGSLLQAALLAAAVTQAMPMGMLAMIPPMVASRGLQKRRSVWTGAVLACGSLGGIAGALGAGLLLLPALGLTRGYLAVAAVLVAASLPGILGRRRLVAGLVAAAVIVAGTIVWWRHDEGGVIHSAYGQIEVRPADGGKVLLVDGLPQTGMPGAIAPGEALARGYLLELAPRLVRRAGAGGPPPRALVVGLGGGLAPRVLAAAGFECHCVELDPQVVRVAREQFGFDGKVYVEDGRRFLQQRDWQWEVIFLDVCTSDRLALHLFTTEVLALARRRLMPDGVLVIQFIGADGPWSAGVLTTVRSVFSEARLLAPAAAGGEVGPRWIFAADRPLGMLDATEAAWRAVEPKGKAQRMTDDHARAEGAWNRTARRWRATYGQ